VRRSATIAILLAGAALAAAGFAPTGALASCTGQGDADAPAAVQERAMLCLVNQARGSRGLAPLTAENSLGHAADRKSADMLRCDEFSHEACGHDFTYWMDHFGYDGCAKGENIAWGSGGLGTPRSIFKAWMHSQGHRENILGSYEDVGVGLKTGSLEGVAGAHVWTQEFGGGC
jgi:uncharacterized protein YkwD